MEADNSLAEAALAMIDAAVRSRSPARVLRRRCPHISRQVVQLRRCRPLLSLWGRSQNVDENVHLPIVHPSILHTLGQLAGVPLSGGIVHAGLEHTYGYLFSLIETPYGYKRDRWTQPTIENGFGIPVPTLRDQPTAGTLLTNLTWFAGQFAFRDRPRERRLLERTPRFCSPVVRQYPYADLEVCRVIEEVSVPGRGGHRFAAVLQTTLVPFPHRPVGKEADDHLLIYSAASGRTGLARLITVFPVTRAVADRLTRNAQGEVEMTGLPYNAYVRGLSGRTFRARRHVVPAARGC